MNDAQVAADRVDLIKRLFAVTISVGFAAQLTKIVFDTRYVIGPELQVGAIAADHWRDGLLLIISLVAVVASWEGYLKAVSFTPHEDRIRFYIDIVIVFLYMILLLSSGIFHLWYHLLVAIFVCYALWDLVRILAAGEQERRNVGSDGYIVGGFGITVLWLAFFVAVDCLRRDGDAAGFAAAAASALLGIVLYRVDKWRRVAVWQKGSFVVVALIPVMLPLL